MRAFVIDSMDWPRARRRFAFLRGGFFMKANCSFVIATFVVAGNLQNVVRAGETTADEQAIRDSAKEFVDAYDHGNAEAVAAKWTTDGEYIIGSRLVKGRSA